MAIREQQRGEGVGREKYVADPLTCTPREKSATDFAEASIHRLPSQ
jgi:hypothetical protein